jgi:hypothetical protein
MLFPYNFCLKNFSFEEEISEIVSKMPPRWGLDVPLATALCKNLPAENAQKC